MKRWCRLISGGTRKMPSIARMLIARSKRLMQILYYISAGIALFGILLLADIEKASLSAASMLDLEPFLVE